MTKNNFSLLILGLSVLTALTFIFIFDVSGESAGESYNPILSGTNRALGVEIVLKNWKENLPPPTMFTWDDPFYRTSVRESVPEIFPEDREALVFADHIDADGIDTGAGEPTLILHFQYDKDSLTHEKANELLSRLAAAYALELAGEGIEAVPREEHMVRETDLRPIFLTLILIKAAVAALTLLFILTVFITFVRPAFGYKTAFAVTLAVFLAGALGLAICSSELLLKSEFANYLPPSVVVGQKISVRKAHETQSPVKYDWRALPQSARYRLALYRKEAPSIHPEDAQLYFLSYPGEFKLMRGEEIKREPGWHFTLRLVSNAVGDKGEERDAFLAEFFWKLKTAYESLLAEDGLELTSEGEIYFIEDFPFRRAHTRARSLAVFGITVLCFCVWFWRKK